MGANMSCQEVAPQQLCELLSELGKELGGIDLQKLTMPGRKVRIVNTSTGRSLYAQKGSDWDIEVGASLFRDGTFDDAVWEFRPVQSQEDDTFRIVNSYSQRCLYAQVDKDGQDGFGASSISHPDWADSHWHIRAVEDESRTETFGPSFIVENAFSKRRLMADDENWDRGLGAGQGAQDGIHWKIIGADLVALLALPLQAVADVAKGVKYSHPNVAKVLEKLHEVISRSIFSEAAMKATFEQLQQQLGQLSEGEMIKNKDTLSEVMAWAPSFLEKVYQLLANAKVVELVRAVVQGDDDINLQPLKQLKDDLVEALVEYISSQPSLDQVMPSELLKWAES